MTIIVIVVIVAIIGIVIIATSAMVVINCSCCCCLLLPIVRIASLYFLVGGGGGLGEGGGVREAGHDVWPRAFLRLNVYSTRSWAIHGVPRRRLRGCKEATPQGNRRNGAAEQCLPCFGV